MSVRFEIAKTPHGSPDKRFIQLKGHQHKISSSDPDINWSPGFCKDDKPNYLSESFFDDSLRPLSIQVGANQYWKFGTAWGLFEFPNNKVSEIIEKKFIDKYGIANIITHKYQYKKNGKDKAFLLVIRSSALISVYSTIILASKFSREYIDTEKLYIGVINDENVKYNVITDCGRVKHYYPFPKKFKEVSEMFDLKNKEDLFKMELMESSYNVENVQGIKSANHTTKDGFYTDTLTLDNEYSKKLSNIISGNLEKINRDDILYFIKFKNSLQSLQTESSVSLTSKNKKGELVEHGLDDIFKKIEEAESKILKLG